MPQLDPAEIRNFLKQHGRLKHGPADHRNTPLSWDFNTPTTHSLYRSNLEDEFEGSDEYEIAALGADYLAGDSLISELHAPLFSWNFSISSTYTPRSVCSDGDWGLDLLEEGGLLKVSSRVDAKSRVNENNHLKPVVLSEHLQCSQAKRKNHEAPRREVQEAGPAEGLDRTRALDSPRQPLPQLRLPSPTNIKLSPGLYRPKSPGLFSVSLLSTDLELLSMSDDTESIVFFNPNSPLHPALKSVADFLIRTCRSQQGKRTVTQSPNTPKTPARTGSLSVRGSSGKKRTTASSSKTRQAADNPNDGDDGFDEPPRKRTKTPAALRAAEYRWACPFWALDPFEHQVCYNFKLKRIQDVKQHIQRKHAPEHYCELCYEVFGDSEGVRAHIKDHYHNKPRSNWVGFATRDTSAKLRKKSNSQQTVEEQWFTIWDTLFPNKPRPSSPFLDTHLSGDFHAFRKYHQDDTRICDGVSRVLGSRGLSGEFSAPLVARILAEVNDILCDEWLRARSTSLSPSSSRDCGISSSGEGLQDETATFTTADEQSEPSTHITTPSKLPAHAPNPGPSGGYSPVQNEPGTLRVEHHSYALSKFEPTNRQLMFEDSEKILPDLSHSAVHSLSETEALDGWEDGTHFEEQWHFTGSGNEYEVSKE
ncbi:hypothetical protein OQA88_12777 [Cercophora sp. LCS_1]